MRFPSLIESVLKPLRIRMNARRGGLLAAPCIMIATLCIVAFSSVACDEDLAPALTGLSIYAVDNGNNLIRFGSMTPQNVTFKAPITGLQTGETILGIDFRPADSLMYALGSTNRIYILDTLTAAATTLSILPFVPPLTGVSFGVDFNPVADRIRVHSTARENLRLNQLTGAVGAIDTVLAYAPGDVNFGVTPRIVACAYTNSVPGASGTMLFAIDANLDILTSLPSPNSGQMRSIGAFGIYVTNDLAGLDIDGFTGAAYATLTNSNKSTLYSVNLGSGAMTIIGDVNNPSPLVGIAIAP